MKAKQDYGLITGRIPRLSDSGDQASEVLPLEDASRLRQSNFTIFMIYNSILL